MENYGKIEILRQYYRLYYFTLVTHIFYRKECQQLNNIIVSFVYGKIKYYITKTWHTGVPDCKVEICSILIPSYTFENKLNAL